MPILAVGPLAIVLVAILGALLLYGLTLLAKAIGYLAPDWHIPGLGNIRSAIINGANAAFQAAAGWFDQAAGPAANFLLAPFHLLNHLIGIAINTLQSVFNVFEAVWGGIVTVLHRAQALYNMALAQASKWVLQYYHYAISWADHVYNLALAQASKWVLIYYHYAISWADHVYNLAHAEIGAVFNLAYRLYHDAISWADHVYNLLHAEIATAEARVAHYAAGLFTRAEADLVREAAAAEAAAKTFTTASVGELAHVLTTDIAAPVEQAWIDVRDEVAAIDQILASDLPDIRALVKRLDIARVGDIATATGALAAVDVLVLRYLRDCGIPNCRNLHGFGHDLAALFAVVEGAAFLAFLTDMVRDPDGVAGEVIDIVPAIVTDTIDTFTSAVGV